VQIHECFHRETPIDTLRRCEHLPYYVDDWTTPTTMFSTSNLARCIAALPLLTIASAQYENIEISDVSIVPCPFNIRVDTAPDLSYIDIVYSTKGTTPNSLASYGPKSKPSDNKRRCFTSTTISHPNLTARARPLHMELTGSATLDDGLTAKVETGLTWGYMGAMVSFSSYCNHIRTVGSSCIQTKS
jgi:hypothetical protein